MTQPAGNEIAIYAFVDPRVPWNVYRYVGLTNCVEQRLSTHLAKARQSLTGVACWLRRLVRHGMKPRLVILDHAHGYDEARFREAYWIWRLRSEGQPLLNDEKYAS